MKPNLYIGGRRVGWEDPRIRPGINVMSVTFDLAQDHAAHAELFKRKDNPAKAKQNLNKAIDIFKECGADGWVMRTEEALAAI
jgi:aromatic ring hydroxylase